MFSPEKGVKLSNRSVNKNANGFSSANSTDQGIGSDETPEDLTEADFSLPPVRRKSQTVRRVSFYRNGKQSLESSDLHHTSSGYLSTLSSSDRSSSQRTPTKRSMEESDENISPYKIRKKETSDDANRAKRILKEKSSSENVLRSSTPIRGNTRSLLWGKSRSLHPQKFEPQRSFEKESNENEPFGKPLPKCPEISFDVSELDFTTSLDHISSVEHPDYSNIPPQFQQLMTKSMVGSVAQPKPIETVESQENVQLASSAPTRYTQTSQRRSYHGRVKLDILGKLNLRKDLALNKIFSYLADSDLLNLSHVSKDYKNMIKSHKTWETRRQNYLKTHQQNLENKIPSEYLDKTKLKSRKRVFGETNVNHSMQLRSTSSPPSSPSRKRLQENHTFVETNDGARIRCPSCQKMTAKISSIPIRSSPRKKKKRNVSSILKISSGRVQKRSKSFLDKPSIDSHCSSDSLYVTIPELEERSSSNSSGSLQSPSSDDSSGNEQTRDIELYEYAECSGKICRFKFCLKCKEKYHPRQKCKELSPASPSRGFSFDSSGSCVKRSVKSSKRSLKRLIDIY